MRRKISLLLCFAMFFMTAHTYAANTEKDITVANANELLDFLNNVETYKNSSITLENDINLTGVSTTFTALGMFDGTFDGNNHSITYVNTTNALFESLGENAVVKNLGIAGTAIGENAASIAVTNNGTIENVKSYVRVMAQSKAGGICVTNNGTVKSCEKSGGTYSSANAARTGGIVADNMGEVLKCASFGEVFGNVSRELSMSGNVAGVVAYNSGEVSECTNGATVVGNKCTAGVVGYNAGNISLCVNKGSVNAQGEYSGGIVGSIKKDKVSCEVSYCDNYGTVTSSSLKCGGVAGSNAESSIHHCVNHGDVTGKSYTAGVLGNAWFGSISLCRNYGDVTAEEDVGGVVGHEAGLNIYACDNYGDITLENGKGRIGGVVGMIEHSGADTAIDSCFNAGAVNVKTMSNYSGGIIGKSEQKSPSALKITNCANVGAINGSATVGGIIGGSTGIIQNCYVKNYSNICVSYTEMSNSFVWSEDAGDEYLNGVMANKLGKDKWIQGDEYPIPAAVTQIQESYTDGVVSGSNVEFEYKEDKNYVTTLFVPREYCGPNSLFDIYPEISGTNVNLFMPAEADLSQLTYVTLNGSNEEVERVQVDLSDGKTCEVELFGVKMILTAYQSKLPSVYINISTGTFDEVNSSSDHSYIAYGDLSIGVTEKLAAEKGWKTSYQSIENNAEKAGTIEIRGRGNSSWNTDPAKKKSYQFKMEKKQNLLGLDKDKTYILLQDSVWFIGQKLGLDLGQMLGFGATPKSEFVDVFADGKYIGCMLLCEKVKVGTSGVNISNLEDEFENNGNSIEGLDLSGGYLLEVDNFAGDDLKVITNGNIVSVKSPELLSANVTDDNEYSYIKKYVTDMFDAIYGDGTLPDGTSYLDRIDKESFVRYYWHQELLGNIDCGKGSTYFYKDKDSINPLLYAGPVWDSDYILYDLSAWVAKSVKRTDAVHVNVPTIYNRLMDRKDFAGYAVYYYDKLGIYEKALALADKVDEYYDYIKESAEMDYIRWHISDMNHFNRENATAIKNSLLTRFKWINDNYRTLPDAASYGKRIEITEDEDTTDALAEFSYRNGAMSADVSEGNCLNAVTGRKTMSSKIYGCIDGVNSSKWVYSDSVYTAGTNSTTVSVIAADESNLWCDNPYILLETNSLGYDSLAFSAQLGGSKKGPKNFKLCISADGTVFEDIEGAVYSIKTNKSLENAFVDVSIPEKYSNREKLYLKIVATDRTTIAGKNTSDTPSSGEIALGEVSIRGQRTEQCFIEDFWIENNVLNVRTVNNTGEKIEGSLVAAGYSDDRLIDAVNNKLTLDSKEEKTYPVNLINDSYDKVKIMYLYSLSTLIPICNSASIKH